MLVRSIVGLVRLIDGRGHPDPHAAARTARRLRRSTSSSRFSRATTSLCWHNKSYKVASFGRLANHGDAVWSAGKFFLSIATLESATVTRMAWWGTTLITGHSCVTRRGGDGRARPNASTGRTGTPARAPGSRSRPDRGRRIRSRREGCAF